MKLPLYGYITAFESFVELCRYRAQRLRNSDSLIPLGMKEKLLRYLYTYENLSVIATVRFIFSVGAMPLQSSS